MIEPRFDARDVEGVGVEARHPDDLLVTRLQLQMANRARQAGYHQSSYNSVRLFACAD